MDHSKKTTTLENILNVAQKLFLNRGFTATSVDEICKNANITKGGFFHYFKTKECLAKQVLQRFCSDSHNEMRQACCREKMADPLDRVFASLDGITGQVVRKNKHQGCLITTFIQELSQSHPEIQSLCVEGLKEWASMLKSDLKLAKEKYAPDSKIDINSLANYCVTVVEGAQILAKANGKSSEFNESIQHLKNYLMMVFKIKQRGGRYD
jgi:TetR/AcrR family transcriptional repressor of nem operon